MQTGTQISAIIPRSLKAQLDRHVRATGVKKAHLIQEALSHHLAALEALPADMIVPARIVVSKKSGIEVAKQLLSPGKPTKALRDLMRNGD